jgi:hypothetical protein
MCCGTLHTGRQECSESNADGPADVSPVSGYVSGHLRTFPDSSELPGTDLWS